MECERMKLYEYMAKEYFSKYGIPTPAGQVADSPVRASEIAADIGRPVVIKSQVLTGGRGKAGGIKFADNPEDAAVVAGELVGADIRGFRVDRVLVEEKLTIDQEIYVGFTVDGAARRPLLIASARGGVNIEDVPERDLVKLHVPVAWGLTSYKARTVARRLELAPDIAGKFARVLVALYRLFRDLDAELTEINPLVVSEGDVIAADGRLNIDSDALYRHDDIPVTSELTELEARVRAVGLSYVELDGDIAVMANGAGITMATIDILDKYGGTAMNFLDAGGGAGMEPMARALGILVETRPRAILVNIFGGITRCDDVARAIIQVKRDQGIDVPLVVRLVGTNEDEGVALLKDEGLQAFSSMDEAAERVVTLARGNA